MMNTGKPDNANATDAPQSVDESLFEQQLAELEGLLSARSDAICKPDKDITTTIPSRPGDHHQPALLDMMARRRRNHAEACREEGHGQPLPDALQDALQALRKELESLNRDTAEPTDAPALSESKPLISDSGKPSGQ